MAVGCYAAGILTVNFGWPLPAAILCAAAGTAAFGACLGYPALRTRGIYLMLLTVGVSFSVRVALENFDYVGGILGFKGMSGGNVAYAVAAVIVVGSALWVVSRSPLQRVLDAVRGDEAVAASIGINVAFVKIVCFAAGAGVAAVAGAIYGHFMSFVRPENFDILVSIFVVLYVILGGVNNMWGALVGATVMTLLPEYVRALADWRPTAFGIAILAILTFRPSGLLAFRSVTGRAADAKPRTYRPGKPG